MALSLCWMLAAALIVGCTWCFESIGKACSSTEVGNSSDCTDTVEASLVQRRPYHRRHRQHRPYHRPYHRHSSPVPLPYPSPSPSPVAIPPCDVCTGCYCSTCGTGLTEGCAQTQSEAWCDQVPGAIWCGAPSPPAPPATCSPAPAPPAASVKWAGFATVSFDGPGDTPFCGKPLNDTLDYDVVCYNAGVSVPWSLLCREFGSKPCLLYHMCPQCWEGDEEACKGQSPPQGNPPAVPLNCPDVEVYKSGLDKYGICWEAQPTKWLLSDKCFGQQGAVVGQGPGEGPCFNALTDDINADGAVEDDAPTYLFKMAVGCGGNCYAVGSTIPNDTCPKPSGPGFQYTGDCYNGCSAVSTANPCEPPADPDARANATCLFSQYIEGLPGTEPININNVRHQSCIAPFGADGYFQPVPAGGQNRNWCSGTNVAGTTDEAHIQMNFDLTNNLLGFAAFGTYNEKCTNQTGPGGTSLAYQCESRILRYRRVQCPNQ